MKVSLNWLKEYVPIDMEASDLADLLTMAGLEVEGMEPVGLSLDPVVVGRIVSVDPHPRADRLTVCQVDTGRESVQVVCGAPNAEVGVLAPLALPGVTLPGGQRLKEASIRGVPSVGMLLAEDEAGLTDDHAGILALPLDTPVGASLSSVLSLPDWVLDISITPNRPDWISVLGIAREIAAFTGKPLKRPVFEIREEGPPAQDLTSVTLLDPIGCPRYAAGIIQNVAIRPSPFLIRYRLFHAGVRAINNLVDITNYVMLELGQPLHAFDYDRLKQNRIEVRRATAGEVFMTLDGETRPLNTDHLMICDGERPVALAGIMGGLNSEIEADTRTVLLESACFDPVTIRRGAKSLSMSTEASYRFERGVDIESVPMALGRALSLMQTLGDGQVCQGIVDQYPHSQERPAISLRIERTNRILGIDLTREKMARYLRALELDVREQGPDLLQVMPPLFRVDLTREIDLVEEVARIHGFHHIPVTVPRIAPTTEREAPVVVLGDQVRSIMTGMGFSEAITYSFISPEAVEALGPGERSPLSLQTRILNPLSRDQSIMRTSLIPGLLDAVQNNLFRSEGDLKLFEWGKAFYQMEAQQLPVERPFLTAVATGFERQGTWYEAERKTDFYDLKGVVEALLGALGISNVRFKRVLAPIPGYDQGLCAEIYGDDVCLGQVGRISPSVLRAWDLKRAEAFAFEMDVDRLLPVIPLSRTYKPAARFPAVYRDASVIVDQKVEMATLVDIMKERGGELLESVHIFDLYEGDKLAPSEKAMAFRLCYRSERETLSGEEVNGLHERIVKGIREKTGAKLKEG